MTYIGDPKECFIEQLFQPKQSCETAQIEGGLSAFREDQLLSQSSLIPDRRRQLSTRKTDFMKITLVL